MPADIRHQGFSAKRAMLLVREDINPDIARHARGERDPALSRRILDPQRPGRSAPCPSDDRAGSRQAVARFDVGENALHEAASKALHRRGIRRSHRWRDGRDAEPARQFADRRGRRGRARPTSIARSRRRSGLSRMVGDGGDGSRSAAPQARRRHRGRRRKSRPAGNASTPGIRSATPAASMCRAPP